MHNRKQSPGTHKVGSAGTNDSRHESKAHNCTDQGNECLDATPNGSVEVSEEEDEGHHLDNVVLTEEQILFLQDEIFDFFYWESLENLKDDMQTFFSGWLASRYCEEIGKGDRGERFFTYNKIITLFEKLAPFHAIIQKAYKDWLKHDKAFPS